MSFSKIYGIFITVFKTAIQTIMFIFTGITDVIELPILLRPRFWTGPVRGWFRPPSIACKLLYHRTGKVLLVRRFEKLDHIVIFV